MSSREILGRIDGSAVTRSQLSLSGDLDMSPVSRAALLSAIAGYRTGKAIIVEDEGARLSTSQPGFAKFLSYLLSYPPRSPPITVDITAPAQIGSEIRNIGTVVLVSGGIDSTAGLLWCLEHDRHPRGCWLDYGQPYRVAEESAVRNVTERLGVPLDIVRIDLTREMAASKEDWGYIIPARNFLLCCIAADVAAQHKRPEPASEASTIMLCAHDEELYVPDKSVLFYRLASAYIGAKIWSPFLTANKTDLLAYWKQKWVYRFGIVPSETITCYDGSGRCGRCKACLKRAIAMSVAGWPSDNLKVNPFSDPSALIHDYYWPRLASYPPRRRQDLLLALDANIASLPGGLRGKVAAAARQRRSELDLRKAELGEVSLLNCCV